MSGPVALAESDANLAGREVAIALRNAGRLFMSLGVTLTVGFLVRFWMPRFLGPDAFGRVVFAEEFAAVFFVFVTLGAETYIRKEVAIRPQHATDFLGSLTLVRLAASAVVAVIMGLALAWMNKSAVEWRLVYVFAAGQFFFVLNTSLASVLQAAGTVRELAWINAASKVVWGVGIVVGLLFGGGLIAVALVFLATEAAKAPLLWRVGGARVGLRFRVDVGAASAILLASMPYFLNFVAHRIYAKVDIALLSALTDDLEVGWYGAAANVTFFVYLVLPILNAVVLPMGSRIAHESEAAMHATMRGAVRVVLMLTVPLAILIALNATELVHLLFTASFAPSADILRILAPIVPLTYVCVLLSTHLIQLGRIWRVTKNSIVCLILNPALNVVFIPIGHRLLGDGGAGTAAACATVVTEGVSATLLLFALGSSAVDRKLMDLAWRLAACCGAIAVLHTFTRSLEAYEKSIDPKTMFLLSTDSELFKYLGRPR